MRKIDIGTAVGLATLAFSASAAKAHSLGEAEDTLYGLGYYEVRIERATLPYSFNACKRGVRYHIHINWYGDLVQVDEVGSCGDERYRGDRYDRRRWSRY